MAGGKFHHQNPKNYNGGGARYNGRADIPVNQGRSRSHQITAAERIINQAPLRPRSAVKARVPVEELPRTMYVTFSADDAPLTVGEIQRYLDRVLNGDFIEGFYLDYEAMEGWIVLSDRDLVLNLEGDHFIGNRSMCVKRVKGY